MTVYEKLNSISSDLRSFAKRCIDSGDDDCCAIVLLVAADATVSARNKLAEYGLEEEEWNPTPDDAATVKAPGTSP
jgi:hypothetical protein